MYIWCCCYLVGFTHWEYVGAIAHRLLWIDKIQIYNHLTKNSKTSLHKYKEVHKGCMFDVAAIWLVPNIGNRSYSTQAIVDR